MFSTSEKGTNFFNPVTLVSPPDFATEQTRKVEELRNSLNN